MYSLPHTDRKAKNRWVNGTIAKVEFIDDEKIEIRLKDGSVHTLQKETWENRQYQWDKTKGRITSKVVGTFEQYPIKLAWAITIHKSQGLTFENVIIDLGSGAFVNGQLYTALSRCKTLEGLTLKRSIQKKDIIIDERVLSFYKKITSKKNNDTINLKELFSKKDYLLLRLISVFYPFTNEFLDSKIDLIKTGNCLYSDGYDWAAGLVSHAKYGLCFNKFIDKSIFLNSNLKFEVDNLTSYDCTGFHMPEYLPLDVETEKECVKRKIESLFSELNYQNSDFYKYISKKDELDNEDIETINEIRDQEERIGTSLNYLNDNLEFNNFEELNSLVESSSEYLAINHDFYKKFINFINTNYSNWFENLFDD